MAALTTATAESTFPCTGKQESSESPNPSSKGPQCEKLASLEPHVDEVSKGVNLLPENTSQSKNFMSVKDDSTTALSESSRRIMAYFAKEDTFTKESHERMMHFIRTTTLDEGRLYYKETGQELRMVSIYWVFWSDCIDWLFLAKGLDGAVVHESPVKPRDDPEDSTSEPDYQMYMDVIEKMESSGLANDEDDDELGSDGEK